ncbi:MAG: PBP1A family penicillin-binding protein [Deltaproteobacteria bacterium]|nr:PBP1A family penicillin-binding protein [Deltaproteobacteria bacterium]
MRPQQRKKRSSGNALWIAVSVFAAVIVIVAFLFFKANTISRFNQIQATQNDNTIFYDIDKNPFHVISGIEDRKYIKLKNVSRNLQKSVLAIEDARFFQHFGFDLLRIGRIFIQLFTLDFPLQGASTITQQLVKLTLLSPERTLDRKIKEIFMAVAMEMEFSKADILEFYLNKVYLGHRNYGVENASLNYFHKSAANLTLAESAFIAGLIKKPEGYSPFVDLKKARMRQVLVLKRLRFQKWITEDEFMQAVNESILIRQGKKKGGQIAPYFISHTLQLLKEKYGHTRVYGGGLRVYTTLNRKMQLAMEKVVAERMKRSRSFQEVAGVSINASTGHVQALVGGVDFEKSEFNRVTQAKRQPGSSFKPILYSAALMQGNRINDVWIDEPVQYTRETEDELEVYEPTNFSGDYSGPITLAYALRVSNNVVSVQILKKIGINSLMRHAQRFGLELPGKMGLCLALGCGELTLLDLTSAFTVFANNGFRNEPVFILKVNDNQGNLLEEFHPQPETQVLPPDQTFQMNRLLQDVVKFGTGRNAKIDTVSGGKTGTSDNFRDAWYVGFTPTMATGFWVGNDDNTPMENEVGGKAPARLWRDYMNLIPDNAVLKRFPENEAFHEYLLCNNSGKLATDFDTNTSWYALKDEDAPVEFCDLHTESGVVVKLCKTSGKLATRYCPLDEVEMKGIQPADVPSDYCDVHFDESFSRAVEEDLLQRKSAFESLDRPSE